jgi:predicted dehydrogenase
MTDRFVWAIVGPGAIAHRFADAVHRMPDAEVRMVCGRDAARSAAFAQHWCRDGHHVAATTDFTAALADPVIQGIYIATPHSAHEWFAAQGLAAGKAVLCEKPLTLNAAGAARLAACARQHRSFLMEAMWTRFLPIYDVVAEWLRAGHIGALRSVQSSFCFNVPYSAGSRLYEPHLGGGCLLDIGIYNLSITRWTLHTVFGRCPEPTRIAANGVIASSGVEQRASVQLEFTEGLCAQFVCGFDGVADNTLRVLGEHGWIELPPHFWEATRATLHRPGQPPLHAEAPFRANGFEYEIDEAMRCARAGLVESPRLPHAETQQTLQWIDTLRQQIGAAPLGAASG